MGRTISLILGALLLAGSPAFAGHGRQGDWELGAYGGFAFLDDFDTFDPDNDVLAGIRFGYFYNSTQSVEGSIQQVFSSTDVGSSDFNIQSLRVNFLWNYRPGAAFRPFWTVGAGAERTDVDNGPGSSDLGVNAGAGARWFFTESFGVRFDARFVVIDAGQPFDDIEANVETSLGVLISFGGGPPPDADHDGVEDRKDKCPDTPAGARVDLTGCPIDSDGDGVFDGLDQCRDTQSGWPVDETGCPKDSDGDGVADGIDDCPDTPQGATVDEKGCPSDPDGDGVVLGLDRCPDTPQGATVDKLGCPHDTDHDRVYDGIDQCPDTPYGVEVDEKGCQVIQKAPPLFEPGKESLVLEGVTFESDQAVLTPGSISVLDEVAASLRDWPQVRVEIGGYTDSSGSAAHNRDLSLRRAEAVRRYLIERGIDPARLVAKGYGEENPIADNSTPEGRAKNRRVELSQLGDGETD